MKENRINDNRELGVARRRESDRHIGIYDQEGNFLYELVNGKKRVKKEQKNKEQDHYSISQ